MKAFTCIIIFFILLGCHAFKKSKNKNYFFEGYGTNISPIDSDIKKDIQIVHFGSQIGVIFPSAYAKKKFGTTKWAGDKTFITPDTDLIKNIDQEINKQYCSFRRKAIAKSYFNINIDSLGIDSTQEKKYRLKYEAIDKWSEHDCDQWKSNSPYYDKQYIGYITVTGEKIIYIKLIDFREDPYHLKPYLETSLIDGWHGWFYSNVMELHFDATKNTFMATDNL